MRVLITGGTGLIGRALSASLVSGGYEVVVLSRNPERVSEVPAGVRVVGWDGMTDEGWGPLVDGAEAVINLAGESIGASNFNLLKIRWTRARKERIFQSRKRAGQAILQAIRAAERKPAVLLQASAVGYYGKRGKEVLTEDEPPGDDFQARVCQEWEASTAEVEDLGIRRVVTRSGVVLSERGGALPLQLLPFRFFVGGPLGNGQQGYSWVHIADEVGVIQYLIENKQAKGVYNLTAPEMLTNAQFSRVVAKALNRPALIPAPAIFFKLAFGEAASILLDGWMVSSKKLENLGYEFRFPRLEEGLRDLLGK